MPAEPFFDSHTESVHVLVHLFNKSNSLDDRLVLTVDVEFHIVSREGMGETEFSFVNLEIFLFDKGREVGSDSSE